MDDLLRWVRALPKAELHVHLEGTLEPEMMFALAERNRVSLPYASVEQVRAAYRFERLDDFLAIYYRGMSVLRTEDDFRELTLAYLQRAHADGVAHAEVFFDPQAHLRRGIPIAVVVDGIVAALREAERKLGTTTRLIMCFLRDLPEADAMRTLEAARPFLGQLTAVGLDSSELGHPPAGFARVFATARDLGLRRVAHAGEEGPPEYVRQALDLLGVDRLDHGNRAMEDPALVARLRDSRMTLTVCPLSNLRLGGVKSLAAHPLRRMLEAGLRATVNSDDPAYFGGYLHDNYAAMIVNLGLSREQVLQLVRNSWHGAFLEPQERAGRLDALEACARGAPLDSSSALAYKT